jgi:hypothetical protein
LIRLWATRVGRNAAATLQNDLVEMIGTRIITQTIQNRFHECEDQLKYPIFALDSLEQDGYFLKNMLTGTWSNGATCCSLTNPDSVCITLTDEFGCEDPPAERYLDCILEEKVSFGGESIMIWGGITLNGRREVHRRSFRTTCGTVCKEYGSRIHFVAG